MFSITNALLGAILFLALCAHFLIIKLKKDISDMFKTFTLQYLNLEENKINSTQYIMDVAHFNSLALRHALNALRPYVISIMNNAVEREDFEEAQICKDMIAQMDETINKKL